MSRRLAQMINRVVTEEGMQGKARLSMAAGKSTAMIDRYRKELSTPPSNVARILALACGASETEAFELALECTPMARVG